MQPPALRLPIRQLLLIIVGLTFALMAQAWLSRLLQVRGYEPSLAHYLAYLVVPPILLLMLAPVLFEHRAFLVQRLQRNALSIRLVLTAIALGMLARVAWWAQLVARISFGITADDDPLAITGPVFSWACPSLPLLMPGLLVMAVLIPFMEETVDRGLLQSAFVHRGPLPAILISAIFFTVFHPPSSYGFVFLMGTLFGIQFWVTGSLWASMITHATYNGLIQFDWRCLQGQWNPPAGSLPQLLTGVASLSILMVALLLIATLLRYQKAGARSAPAQSVSPVRSRRAR